MPVPAGATAVIELSELTRTLVAGVEPNLTVTPPENPVPSMLTWVPPPVGPPAGLANVRTAVTVGADRYWKTSPALVGEVPTELVTVTSTLPLPGGAVATITVPPLSEAAAYEVAGVDPNMTALAPPRWVPAMVTAVPPEATPNCGLIEATVGAAVAV